MTSDRLQQAFVLFQASYELEAESRFAYLEAACNGDAELRREVESLLASYEQAEDFMSEPAVKAAAEVWADDTAVPVVGRTLAHFQVLSLLGKGGMGEVYLAEDIKLGRKVALKFLPAHFMADADSLRRFEQEAKTASAFSHPNIVTIYEIAQEGELHFIVEEYIEGRTLRQKLAAGCLSIAEALDIAVQIANALTAAHEAGIIHRDIKPENIMLRSDGFVKVLDFGLAKLTGQDEGGGMQVEKNKLHPASLFPHSLTKPSLVMGTPQYMSPEQANGLRVDTKTDLFSLGMVLYEMVAGRTPFAGESARDTVRSIVEKEPTPLRQFAPEAPDELVRIVNYALHKERTKRYQTAAGMRRDLELLGEGLKANAGLPSNLSLRTGRSVSLPILGGIVLAVVIAGLWLWRSSLMPARTQPQPTSPQAPLLAPTVQTAGNTIPPPCLQSFTIGNVTWCITQGSGEHSGDDLILRPTEEKAEAWGNLFAAHLDCVFELTFNKRKGDSSVGLEIWDRMGGHTPKEYSLTFRGGAVRIVSKGIQQKMRLVKSYVGRPLKVHLKASPEWLYAELDGQVLIDQKNTFWPEVRLKPRLNADAGDTITLHSCSCSDS